MNQDIFMHHRMANCTTLIWENKQLQPTCQRSIVSVTHCCLIGFKDILPVYLSNVPQCQTKLMVKPPFPVLMFLNWQKKEAATMLSLIRVDEYYRCLKQYSLCHMYILYLGS